jgi:hypothetical protein
MNETQTNATHEARNAQMGVLTAMPDVYMRTLQRTGTRMLRAQERMLQSLMQAGHLQMKFSQDFWAARGAAGRTEGRQDIGTMAVAETERMLSHLHEITETVQRGVSEALQSLMDTAEATAQDAHDTALRTADDAAYAAQAGAEAMKDTIDRTTEATSKLGETAIAPPDRLSRAPVPKVGN